MTNKKPSFKFNSNSVKSSSDQYRNIKGVHYICYTSNPLEFDKVRAEAKEKGLKTKIIKGEMFIEKI